MNKQLMALIIFASYTFSRNTSFLCPVAHEIDMIFFKFLYFSFQKSLVILK